MPSRVYLSACPSLLALSACCLSLLVAGCESGSLTVDLRTDFVPGVEFTGVRVQILEGGLSGTAVFIDDRLATTDQDYRAGLRIRS